MPDGEDPVFEVFQVDRHAAAKPFGDRLDAACPASLNGAKQVEEGATPGAQMFSHQIGKEVPGELGFHDVAVVGDRQVIDDRIETSGFPEPFDGVGVMPDEGLEPGNPGSGEEFPAGGIEVDGVDPGCAAEGAERGDHAAAAEAEQGDVAGLGGAGHAGGGEDIEDAVGGAGAEEHFAEDGPVLRDAPAAPGAADGGAWIRLWKRRAPRRVLHARSGRMTLPWTSVRRNRRPWKK